VFDPAKTAFERCRHDDDGNLRAAATQLCRDLRAKLTCAKVIVQDGDVNLIQHQVGFLDGGRGDRGISVLTEDRGAEMQVYRIVVEQENTYARGADEFEAVWLRWLRIHWQLDAPDMRRATFLLTTIYEFF